MEKTNQITKDPALANIYVRRCKCGERPYYDRILEEIPSYGCWVQCTCGLVGESGSSKKEAIDNWNAGKIKHNEDWLAIANNKYKLYKLYEES